VAFSSYLMPRLFIADMRQTSKLNMVLMNHVHKHEFNLI
jgi:hypothetical protein